MRLQSPIWQLDFTIPPYPNMSLTHKRVANFGIVNKNFFIEIFPHSKKKCLLCEQNLFTHILKFLQRYEKEHFESCCHHCSPRFCVAFSGTS